MNFEKNDRLELSEAELEQIAGGDISPNYVYIIVYK